MAFDIDHAELITPTQVRVFFTDRLRDEPQLYDPSNYALIVKFGYAEPAYTGQVVPTFNVNGLDYVDMILRSPVTKKGAYAIRVMGIHSVNGFLIGEDDGEMATIDNETPVGLIDGVNQTYTLRYIPNPVSSLKVYVNGVRQTEDVHYTISNNHLVFQPAFILQPGDTLLVDYRH